MSITIELEPETEARLRERAERNGQAVDHYAADALRRLVSDVESDSSFEKAFAALQNRTPEQIAEARAHVLAASRRAKPLPPGKTLEDMVFGEWPGDETDEQINTALEELS